jgi:hypothetical protein
MIYLFIPEPPPTGRKSLAILPITRCFNYLGGLVVVNNVRQTSQREDVTRPG